MKLAVWWLFNEIVYSKDITTLFVSYYLFGAYIYTYDGCITAISNFSLYSFVYKTYGDENEPTNTPRIGLPVCTDESKS